MRVLQTIAVALLAASCALPVRGQQAALFDELAVLYPDTDPESGVEGLAGDTARGVPAGVHALITGLPPRASVRCNLKIDAAPVIARVFRAFNDYEKDVAAYRAGKRELLTALPPAGGP